MSCGAATAAAATTPRRRYRRVPLLSVKRKSRAATNKGHATKRHRSRPMCYTTPDKAIASQMDLIVDTSNRAAKRKARDALMSPKGAKSPPKHEEQEAVSASTPFAVNSWTNPICILDDTEETITTTSFS